MKLKEMMMVISFVLITIQTVYGQTADREYLDVGDTVSRYPKVEWIKGIPVGTFEQDKVYIIDLWATWCKPCIAAMPHLSTLATKYKDRGVVFIAQDVMEEDRNKVVDFLKNNEKMMNFNVGFGGGKGSEFERDWIKPAGVSAIPETFVVKNHVLLWQTSPDMITEEVLEMLISGNFSIEAATKKRGNN